MGLKPRYVLSMGVGLSLGFLLSITSLKMLTICDSSSSNLMNPFAPIPSSANSNNLMKMIDANIHGHRSIRSPAESTLVDYASKEYEPRIVPIPDVKVNSSSNSDAQNNSKKLVRSRYIADELGIREKVLVSVLTESKNLNTFAIFINQTLRDHVDQILFFIHDKPETIPHGMEVLSIDDSKQRLKPFYVLNYLALKKLKLYDWFFLVPDNTFIRGSKLNEFLNHISINQDLYMGQTFDDQHQVYCFYGSGILFSGTVIQKIFKDMDWCTKNAFSTDMTDNIGRCVSKVAQIHCTNTTNNLIFRSTVDYRFEFDRDIMKMSIKKNFNQTLTVHPVNDLETMLKLQKYFNEVEIDEMMLTIAEYEKMIKNLSCYSIEGCGNTQWPIGVPSAFKPTTRFDVLRWDYFNETHLFFKLDNQVVTQMNRIDYDDIHEVIQFAVEQFSKKYSKTLKCSKLIDGYRRFDPTRGTEYILDLSLIDSNGNEFIKRAELMRPLGLVEIIPMPFAVDSTNLTVIVPIHDGEETHVMNVLQHFSQILNDSKSHERLGFLFTRIVTNDEDAASDDRWFDNIRQKFNEIRSPRSTLTAEFHTVRLPSNSLPRYAEGSFILDFYEKKLHRNEVIFLTTSITQIDIDFFNRCRLNVIENTQIFSPIAFHKYHPKVLELNKADEPKHATLHKFYGWFNAFAFDQIGLYISDYIKLKENLVRANVSVSSKNLHDLFIEWTDLHVLRAPDQSLRVRYQSFECQSLKQINSIEYHRCLIQMEMGLGSRTQLASTIIEHQKKSKQKENV